MAGLSRASRFGALKDHFRAANDNIGIVVQIETLQAVDQIEKIAAVPGVDAVFIGPTDLSGSMGLYGQGGHPDVQQVLADCAGRCAASGTPIGTLAGTIDAARAFAQQGFDYVVLASDLGLLLSSARSALAQWRSRAGDAQSGASDHASPGY
jgi:2-keto-3-deoxy-L-rhamnonate aldolase RhmA